jgi:hypothetical protein
MGRRVCERGDRTLLASALLGFSVWQFIDIVMFHWVLVIHRIRVDVPNPFAYDLGWLVAFGVTTLLAAWLVWRGAGRAGGPRAAAGLAILAVLAAPTAALPPPGTTTLVLFEAAIDPARSFAAVASIDARVIWSSPAGDVMAITTPPGSWAQALQLYGHGALVVGSTPALGGCVGWARTLG